jgi:hypothetical protein
MYKLFSTFVGCFETASKCRPSVGLCASLAVGLFSLYFVALQATSPKVLCIYQKIISAQATNENFC